jgi:DNA polymerase-3 subunit alpha
LDGLNSPTELIQAAKDMGQPGMALTDHGTLSGHRELQRAARNAGIVPILGVEAYISPTDRFDKRPVKSRDDNTNLYSHIILLAKNQTGVENINKMSTEAWTNGYYYKPRIDRELLAQHKDGIIVLSGCLNGLIAKAIEREDFEEADALTRWFKEEFDDDFYMEVQTHNPLVTNQNLLRLADQYSIKPIVTSDCHYAREEDKWIEDALLILSTKPKKNDEESYDTTKRFKDMFERLNALYPERTMTFEQFKLFVQSRPDIYTDFQKQEITREDIYDNTLDVLSKIGDYDYHQGVDALPRPKRDAGEVMKEQAYLGLESRGLGQNPEARKRLDMEIDIVIKKNFSAYFLAVGDLVAYCKKNNIMVGPGRGSSAGSLLAYCLYITEINPLDYGLLFARFINEDRNDYPDIDVDIEGRRRNEVKEYATKKFKHVASVSNYNTFADKGVIKDAARVLGIPVSVVNKATKEIETFEQFEDSPLTQEFRNKYPEVLVLARKLRGHIRASGMHAGGLVISNKPIEKYAPIETRTMPNDDSKTKIPVIALDKEEIADIGLIKIDMLGVKTLSVIADAIEMIKDRHGVDIDPLQIPMDDPKVYSMISKGFTKGVFQAEANPSTNLILEMGCDNFDELVVSNALVRPGAKNTVGKSYIARKQGREQVKTPHPILDEITKDTYGLIIYQEQVMLACVKLGGFSWSEADEIRSIIGKKKDPHKFDAFRAKFIEGATQHITQEQAEQLWHDFEAHAGYSFNKSHAVAYSRVSYWTAWLKYYYKHEYMCALLRNEDDKPSITGYLIEAKRLGIKVLLPHVNVSGLTYELEGDAIRIGLGNIKFITERSAPALIRHRPFTSFKQLSDLVDETGNGISSNMVKALDLVGAAEFPDNPRTGKESQHYYEYMLVPKFDTSSVPAGVLLGCTPASEYDEEGTFFIMAMVTDVRIGKGWKLADFVDESGQAAVFTSGDTEIEKGMMYLMLVSDNRVQELIPAHEIKDNPDNPMVKYLSGSIEHKTGYQYVVSFSPYITKAKKKMAYSVIVNDEGEMRKVMVFEDLFRTGLGRMIPGRTVPLSLARLKSGALFVKEIYSERRKP